MSTQIIFKKGTDVDTYQSQRTGDVLLEIPEDTTIARLYYQDDNGLKNITSMHEYGTELPTSNNYEGKLFFKII